MAETSSDHRFHCSVCLDLYTDPVSTPCGHNFCKLCIEQYWDSSEEHRCPLCNEAFHKMPEFRINISFRDAVDEFKITKARSVVSGEVCEARDGDVVCDICTDVKLKATKSCLVCMASYCESHLEPHVTAAALSRHKLIGPVSNLEDRICKRHEKILELFCKKDEQFICLICAETDHSQHQVVVPEAASQQAMMQSKRRGREVDLMIQDRQKRIEEIKCSQRQTKDNAQKEMETSVQVFASVMGSIKKTHDDLLEEIRSRHEAAQQRFEGLIKELKQEIQELEKKSVELQQLSDVQDDISLFQAFKQANALPPTQNWPSIHTGELDFLGYVRTSLISARELISQEIKKQSATELKKMQKFAEDITIDQDTAGPWITVSEDGKEVRQSPKKLKVPTSQTRFMENTFVVATQSLTRGRHYWEVGVKEASNWVLGVASDTLESREYINPCPESGLWTVGHKDGGRYFVCKKNPLPLFLTLPPRTVGVFVDYEEGQVSFINVDCKTHIFTFTKCNFKGGVFPIFDPGLPSDKRELVPLKILMVQVTK